MIIMKKLFYIIPFIVLLLLTSCTQRLFDFTIISTKNLDLSKMDTFERGRQRVEGTDGVNWILMIPLGFPNIKQAIDRAIEMTPGAVARVDGVVFSKSWFAIVTAYTSYVVEGTPIIDPLLASLNDSDIGTYNYCRLNKKGEIKEIKIISKEEFEAEKNKIVASK